MNPVEYFPARSVTEGGHGGDVVVTCDHRPTRFRLPDGTRTFSIASPTRQGPAFGSAKLNEFEMPLIKLVNSFLATPEHYAAEVDQFYSTYLHRREDRAGLVFWGESFDAGIGCPTTNRGLFAVRRISRGTCRRPRDFVQALYQDVLTRAASASEVASWQQQLAAGTLDRGAVARDFVTSGEAYRDAVNQDFAQFLGQPTDAEAEQYFVAALQNGTKTPVQVVVEILLSGEYYNRQILRSSYQG